MKRVVDDFSDPSSWLGVASGQAKVKISSEPAGNGRALRLDFDFKGGGGFVGARKDFAMRLPEAYAFSFRARGVAPKNKFEFKLADSSGKNVWRWQDEAFDFKRAPRELFIKSSQMDFAWGPAGGGTLRKLGPVEFIISAGPGGKGTVWLEDFCFVNRTVRKPPVVTASSSVDQRKLVSVLDPNSKGGWRSAARDSKPWLQIDFHQAREYGGLVIDWEPRLTKGAFAVEASNDGRKWRTIHRRIRPEGARSFVYLPRAESRFLRVAFEGSSAIRHLEVQPFDFSRSLVDFAHAVAERSPRGRYPRYFLREQSYWTCAGVPDGRTCALINEEGLVEPDKGTFTLEPFLYADGKLITWADVKRSVQLEDEGLAIPSARWELPGLRLETTAFATGQDAEATLFVRYRVSNLRRKTVRTQLFVALRPYQVTPPWQGWNGLGGLSAVKDVQWMHGGVMVNRSKWVVPLSRPAAFGAAAFAHGVISDYLAQGRLPLETRVRDDMGLASAAMRFELALSAGETRDVFVAVPFGAKPKMNGTQVRKIALTDGAAQFDEAVRVMHERIGSVSFRMPRGVAREAARTFRAAAGQILINRDGPALQPGPRRYTRSWIRDGVIMGAALLRIGDQRALPEFMRWYVPFQRKDGFVPCCVDRSGPDWLVEHDSHGQLIYGVRESFRFARDRKFLEEMWPHVRKAARYIEALRAQRLTRQYKTPDKIARYGLLPESASHEGYLAHPVHSYWDDAWALRGLKDAAEIARELGYEDDAQAFSKLAESFHETFSASVRAVIAQKKLRYVPASVEWADFDPTATSNTINMLQGETGLPTKQVDGLFDEFLRMFREKHVRRVPWNNYTAYEIRIIGALVRLGKRAEALEMLEFFLSDRRPRRWNQWPEISWRNPRSPGHLGDVPHTWIASEYMLVFASLFAFERATDDALVIGAGVDDKWLTPKGGCSIRGLPTEYGRLDLAMKLEDDSLVVELGGTLRLPAGGFVVAPPTKRAIHSLTVNGSPASTFNAHEAVIHTLPASIVIKFA